MTQVKRASEEPVVLVAGADDKFALGLTVALFSALRRLQPGRRAHVYVIDGGICPGNIDRCRGALKRSRPGVDITFVKPDISRFARLHATEDLTRATYLRLVVPEIVSERYRRVLYLDCDTVVTGNVAELWSIPEDGTALRAVCNLPRPDSTAYFKDSLWFAGVPEGALYFNAGVLLIDLPAWKRDRISERAEAILAEHSPSCRFLDQDALNIVAIGRWAELPVRWNLQIYGSFCQPGSSDDLNRPGILHFTGPEKPWNLAAGCLRQAAFDEALRASGWYSPGEFRRNWLRKNYRALKWWLRTSPALDLPRRARRRVAGHMRRLVAPSS